MASGGLQCFLCYIICLVQLNVSQHPVRSGTAWPARWRCPGARHVCVCDITFCCGKKALHQPADCAHCLPLCDFTARVSELGDLQKHINCMRHQCQHADCLSFRSWCGGQFGGKLFPSELWLSSRCMHRVTHADISLFVAPVCSSVQLYILCSY